MGHATNTAAAAGSAPVLVDFYSYSRAADAYITHYIWLTDGEDTAAPRFTEMRYRDMIIDNIVASGGRPESLRWLGVHNIINESATLSINRLFILNGMRTRDTGIVIVRPGDPRFEECRVSNPFLRGQGRLLEHSADPTGGAFIKQVIFVSEGFYSGATMTSSLGAEYPRLHMITEFDRPGTSEYQEDVPN